MGHIHIPSTHFTKSTNLKFIPMHTRLYIISGANARLRLNLRLTLNTTAHTTPSLDSLPTPVNINPMDTLDILTPPSTTISTTVMFSRERLRLNQRLMLKTTGYSTPFLDTLPTPVNIKPMDTLDILTPPSTTISTTVMFSRERQRQNLRLMPNI